jgi:ligand-binding SRPBCC domain-containing protein
MKEFTFHTELWLPRPREEIFSFFAEARNLEAITPPWLKIQVLTPAPVIMRKGTLIDYRISVHGVPVRWRTEITEWQPPHQFVDSQLRGPYVFWHHTHTFSECGNGTLCLDDVRYYPRGGRLINWLFVRHDVARIFGFRRKKLTEIFAKTCLTGSGDL